MFSRKTLVLEFAPKNPLRIPLICRQPRSVKPSVRRFLGRFSLRVVLGWAGFDDCGPFALMQEFDCTNLRGAGGLRWTQLSARCCRAGLRRESRGGGGVSGGH